jgi:hypothetical protein
MNCLYCGNPRPYTKQIENQNSSVGASFSTSITIPKTPVGVNGSLSKDTTKLFVMDGPLETICDYCKNGRYWILVDSVQNTSCSFEFVQNIVTSIFFKDPISKEFLDFEIDPRDIKNNTYAITIPSTSVNSFKKWISHKFRGAGFEMHIMFKSGGKKYYLICYRYVQDNKIVATHIGVLK